MTDELQRAVWYHKPWQILLGALVAVAPKYGSHQLSNQECLTILPLSADSTESANLTKANLVELQNVIWLWVVLSRVQ